MNGPPTILDDSEKGMDGTVKHFFQNGSERDCDTLTDRHGNVTSLTYGQAGAGKNLLTRVTDPSGRYLQITWGNLGTSMAPQWRITEVQGPFDPGTGQPVYTVTYEYGADFNLWKVHQDPSGLNRTTTLTYTTVSGEAGLLASISDPLGHTVSYTYTTSGGGTTLTGTVWVSTVTEPASNGQNHVWTIQGGVAFGGPTLYTFCVSSSGLGSFAFAFDTKLRVILGLLNTASGQNFSYTYDSNNNVSQKTDTAWYTPSSGSPPWSSTTRSVSCTYGSVGNVLTQSFDGFPNTTVTTTYYDASKYFQKASVTDANGRVTSMDYFSDSDPSLGNRGEMKYARDARYGTTGKEFDYTYNSYGQKASETNLNGTVTQYTFGDQWGNLTQTVQDPGTSPHLNRTSTVTYDVAGRVSSSTDPRGQSSGFLYNGAGQPTQATLPGETVQYTYDGNGRTHSVTDNRGVTTVAYETGNDRVSSVTDPVTGTVGYTYGQFGERATMTLPGGGTWTYSYLGYAGFPGGNDDPEKVTKLVSKIVDDQGLVVQYWPDSEGQIREAWTDETYSGSTLTAYLRAVYTQEMSSDGTKTRRYVKTLANDWRHQVMGTWQTTSLEQNDYTYDNAGNRLTNQITSGGTSRTETYGYDELNRLTSVNYGDGQTQSYQFDPMGNRTQKVDSVSGTENSTYNAANMLLTRGANSYTNDTNGNTQTGEGRTNTWDGQNRLTQCVYNGTTSTFTYGADGLRRRMVTGGNTSDYLLDGQSVVRSLLNGVVDRTYLIGPRGPEYERIGAGTPTWNMYDGLGSVLGTVDASGNIVSTRKYDVYGAVRSLVGPTGTRNKFAGGLGHPSDDETGLIYMRARYMDPATGRFASQDPARKGDNWLGYATDNPVCKLDKSGKTTIEEDGAAAAAAAALNAADGSVGLAVMTLGLRLADLEEVRADLIMAVFMADPEGPMYGYLMDQLNATSYEWARLGTAVNILDETLPGTPPFNLNPGS